MFDGEGLKILRAAIAVGEIEKPLHAELHFHDAALSFRNSATAIY